MTDADGQAIAVGYKGMLMYEVVSILTNGNLVWQGGLDNTSTVVTQSGANAHKGQGNWPGVPA